MTGQRDAAQRDVEREHAHGHQRVTDPRTTHDQQVTFLRAELEQVRQEVLTERSRADRAEARLG